MRLVLLGLALSATAELPVNVSPATPATVRVGVSQLSHPTSPPMPFCEAGMTGALLRSLGMDGSGFGAMASGKDTEDLYGPHSRMSALSSMLHNMVESLDTEIAAIPEEESVPKHFMRLPLLIRTFAQTQAMLSIFQHIGGAVELTDIKRSGFPKATQIALEYVVGEAAYEATTADPTDETTEGPTIPVVPTPVPGFIDTLPDATKLFLSSRVLAQWIDGLANVQFQLNSIDAFGGKLGSDFKLTGHPSYDFADASCQAAQYSWDMDVDSEWAMCTLMDFVFSVLSCSYADTFNKDCPNLSMMSNEETIPESWAADATVPHMLDDVPFLTYENFQPCDSQIALDAYERLEREAGVVGLNSMNYVDLEFADLLKQFPDGIPEQLEKSLTPSTYNAMLEDEGIAYFHLFDGVTKISTWANGAYQCGLDSMRSLIPGWRTDMVFALEEEGDFIMSHGPAKRKHLPLFAALKNVYPRSFAEGKNKCVVPLLVRGTGSMYEWRMNFETSLSPRIDSTTGKKHGVSKGYWSGLSGLLPQLESYIVEDVMSRGCTVEELRFVVSGHSLGGGMANVLSLWLGDRFNGSKIDLVAFAAPHNFDRSASDIFKTRVNARNIAAGLDPIARLPCHTGLIDSGFPRCPRGHQIVTKSGDGEREHDLLVEHRGIIHYAPEWFTQWNADWTDRSILTFDFIKFGMGVTPEGVDINLKYLSNAHVGLPTALQLGGWHGVAYPCAFMQYCRSPSAWDTDVHAQKYCVKYGLIPSTHYDQFPLNIHIFVEDTSSVAHLIKREL